MNRFSKYAKAWTLISLVLLNFHVAVADQVNSSSDVQRAILEDLGYYLRQCLPIETVQGLLDDHPDLPMNAYLGLNKETPLEVAIRDTAGSSCYWANHLFERLKAKGANLNFPSIGGITPLTQAVIYQNPTAIEYLASQPETTFDSYPQAWNPFYYSDNQVDFRCTDCSLLEFTSAVGIDPVAFAALVKSGKVNVEDAGKDGTTPLIAAAGFGNLQEVQILLAAGANPNVVNSKGYSALKAVQAALKNPNFSSIVYGNSNPILNQIIYGFGPRTDKDTINAIENALRSSGAKQ